MKYGKYHCKYSYFGNLVEIRIPKKFSVCSNKWTNYKHFQKECKSQVRKAEWNYINDTIMEGLQNNNSKPFWKYAKSRKQDNIGVSPLKSNRQLVNDSKGKADILINQFKSVFTREDNKTLPKTTKHISKSIPDLEIRSEGIEKLLKNINPSQSCRTR